MRKSLITLFFYILGLTIITIETVNAQIGLSPDLFPPSPTATSFAKVADLPVNLYSGTPDISVPVYVLKSRNLTVDISLKYTGASGIKVQDIAGPASQGWTLLAGSVITRTVRSKPDEEPVNGYCRSNFATQLSGNVNSNDFKNALYVAGGDQDIEPDLFNCTIGGRITFNSSRVPAFLNRKGYVIAQNGMFGSDSSWVILDTKGTRYTFGKNSNDREHTLSSIGGHTDIKYYVSSWYLSEIRSVDGDIITFMYEKGKPINYDIYSLVRVYTAPVEGAGGTEELGGPSIRIIDPVYLKKIASSNKQLVFSYNNRWDIPGQKAIEKIAIADLNGNINQAFRFTHGYFNDNVGHPYARPKLLSVELLNNANNKSIPLAKFTYNETELLPPRSSAQFDHWGYYNNNTSGNRLKSEGAVKDASAAKCMAGVLTSIEWSTGGKTLYEYELNTFRKNNITYSGGGLRVSKIKQVEGGQTLETNYSYLNEDNTSSGLLQSRFSPDSGYIATSSLGFFNEQGAYRTTTTTTEYDLPLFQLLDLNGVSVGYSRVVITHPDLSKDIEMFQNYSQYPDDVQSVYVVKKNAAVYDITNQYIPNTHNLFNFNTPKHPLRGLISEKRILKSDGTLLHKINYSYSSAASPSAPVALQIKPYYTNIYDQNNYVSASVAVVYRETADVPQLVSQKNIFYNSDNTPVSREDYFRYQYHPVYPYLINKETRSRPNGDSTVVTYRYPLDIMVEENDIGGYMAVLNVIPPVETVTKNKTSNSELVSDATLNLYTGNIQRVHPSAVSSLQIDHPISDYQPIGLFMNQDSRCKSRISYDLYATSGELLQYHEDEGVPTAVFWGYHHEFPVAKVTGVSYSVAAQNVDTAMLNNNNLSDALMRTELDKLRQNLPAAAVTTYTYSPVNGLSSETDQSGRTRYFEYDEFSRLQNIKDLNGHIVSNQDYHYKSAGGWKDTPTRRCPKDLNGQYTGEEEVQQLDTALNSNTYNQTRWKSLGYTMSCNMPIYVKLYQENQRQFPMGSENGTQTEVDLVVRFFEDEACTVPQFIRSINLKYMRQQILTGPTETYSSSVNGTSFVLQAGAVIKEQSDPGEHPGFLRNYSYSLVAGSEYIVVP